MHSPEDKLKLRILEAKKPFQIKNISKLFSRRHPNHDYELIRRVLTCRSTNEEITNDFEIFSKSFNRY